MSITEQGYLILADISNYTQFLAYNELEHAQEILAELLDLIVAKLTPPLKLASIQGGAVLAYVPKVCLSRGETLIELIETTCVAFKDHLQTMQRHTTCTCTACRAIPTLDLNFFTHFGEYMLLEKAGMTKLLGLDASLIEQRLLKQITDTAIGKAAYALFTQPALQEIGVYPSNMIERQFTFEQLGNIKTYTMNLHDRYQELTSARRCYVDPKTADATLTVDFTFKPSQLWDALNDLNKRPLWIPNTKWNTLLRPAGRTSIGAKNHCAHSNNTMIEQILDWKPFSYYTVQLSPPSGRGMLTLVTYQLIPFDQGTHLQCSIKLGVKLPTLIRKLLGQMLVKLSGLKENLENFGHLLTKDIQ